MKTDRIKIKALKEQLNEEIRNKSIGDLKEQLGDIRQVIRSSQLSRRKTRRDLQRKKAVKIQPEEDKEGLDGILELEQQSIPVSPGKGHSEGLDRNKLNILKPDESGTRIEEIKGLDDILEDE